MKSLSSVGLGLSIVFAILFLALIVELYYLLWWKKRLTTTNNNNNSNNNNATSELFYMFCWKKTALNPQEIRFQNEQRQQQQQQQPNKDLFFKHFDVDDHDVDYDDADTDSDVSCPPRVLFTIVEETKEDLESEESKSTKNGRSLSDVLLNIETPYLTPIGSPPFLTPPLTPLEAACFGFNPLFESKNGEDLSMNESSPPPSKFKFLREAEEKLHRKKITLMERVDDNGNGEEDGSFFTIVVDHNR